MINTVELERTTFAAQMHISRELASDFGNTPDVRIVEYAAHELAMQMRQHIPIYYELTKPRAPMGEYLFGAASQSEQTLFGMKVTIARYMPKDTIELRDKDDRIVGKIYNIG